MMFNEDALADLLFMIKRTTLFKLRTTDQGDANFPLMFLGSMIKLAFVVQRAS